MSVIAKVVYLVSERDQDRTLQVPLLHRWYMRQLLCLSALTLLQNLLGSEPLPQPTCCGSLEPLANTLNLLAKKPLDASVPKTPNLDPVPHCGLNWDDDKLVPRHFRPSFPSPWHKAFPPASITNDTNLTDDHIKGRTLLVPEDIIKT